MASVHAAAKKPHRRGSRERASALPRIRAVRDSTAPPASEHDPTGSARAAAAEPHCRKPREPVGLLLVLAAPALASPQQAGHELMPLVRAALDTLRRRMARLRTLLRALAICFQAWVEADSRAGQ